MRNVYVRAKRILGKGPNEPKVPRKKIQLQLEVVHKEFINQLNLLETRLERPFLSRSTYEIARHLHQTATRFEEIQLVRLNQARLQVLPISLIQVNDFSLWVKHALADITEEIYHFLITLEDA